MTSAQFSKRNRHCHSSDYGQQISEFELAAIRRGVVLVFAIWSGPAFIGLQRFTRQLSTLDLGAIDIIIFDNDSMDGEDMIQLFGRVLHGAGEVFWIRDGRIVAELSAYRPESEPLIRSHTVELLT